MGTEFTGCLVCILLSPSGWGRWRKGSECVSFYHLQRSCRKVMFSQACVKTSVHRGGLPQCMLGYTSPLVRHLEVSASVHAGIHPPVKHPLVRHPPVRHSLPWSDTPSPGQTCHPLVRQAIPWSDTPSPDQTPLPCSDTPLVRHLPLGQTPPWADTPLGQTPSPGQTPPPPNQSLQWTVRILLEYILGFNIS